MKYFRLLDDLLVPDRWQLSAVNDVDNWLLARPPMLAMDDPLRDKVMTIGLQRSGVALDYSLAGYAGIPVVSFKALQAISGLDGFTMLPAKIDKFQQTISYHILHVWQVVDCVDEELSKFEKFQVDDLVRPDLAGNYSAFFELIVDERRAEGKHVFRLARSGPEVIVSEEVKRRLESAGVTGAEFVSVSKP